MAEDVLDPCSELRSAAEAGPRPRDASAALVIEASFVATFGQQFFAR